MAHDKNKAYIFFYLLLNHALGAVGTVGVIMDIIHFSPYISLFITLSGF